MEKVLFLILSYFRPPKHNSIKWRFFRENTFRQKPFGALQENTCLGIPGFTGDGTATNLILLFLLQDSATDQRILEESLDPHSRELFTFLQNLFSGQKKSLSFWRQPWRRAQVQPETSAPSATEIKDPFSHPKFPTSKYLKILFAQLLKATK